MADRLLSVDSATKLPPAEVQAAWGFAGRVRNLDQYGFVGDGIADDTAAITAALTAAYPVAVLVPLGRIGRFTSQIVVPTGCSIMGFGYSATPGVGAASTLLKDGSFDGIVMENNSAISGLLIDGETGNTGDGIWVRGSRTSIDRVAVFRQGGDGVRIGSKPDAYRNANLWRINNLVAVSNTGSGLHIEAGHTPLLPDANAGIATGLDIRNNGQGVLIKNAIDNGFYGLMSATNTGLGVLLDTGAAGNHFDWPYLEANNASVLPEGRIAVGAHDNCIWGYRTVATVTGTWDDLGERNLILSRDNKTGRFTLLSRLDSRQISLTNPAISGTWGIRQNASSRALEFVFQDSSATTSDVSWLTDAAGGRIRHRFDQITFGVVLQFKSADYTAVLTDAGTVIEMNSASPLTFTIPTDAVAFPVGSIMTVVQAGAGAVTIAGAGVTIRSEGSNKKIAGQWGTVTLCKRAANDWAIQGRVIA